MIMKMKGGTWGGDIKNFATTAFAWLFGIAVAILGVWNVANIIVFGWTNARPRTWSELSSITQNLNTRIGNGTRPPRRNRSNTDKEEQNSGNEEILTLTPIVPDPAPPNNGMEGFKLR